LKLKGGYVVIEILIILGMLAFLLFLVLGVTSHLRKTRWKGFILSFLFLCWAILMIVFDNKDLAGYGKGYSSPPIIKKTEPVVLAKIVIPDNGIVDYKVVKGDTLLSIASRAGLSIEKIKHWNGLTTDVIKVNQIIKLYGKNVEPQPPANPPPKQENSPTAPERPVPVIPSKIVIPDNGIVNYQVVKGDTLWSIATRAGLSVEKIKHWNRLTTDVIKVNQMIKLYGKNVEPPPPSTPSTSAPSIGNASEIFTMNIPSVLQKPELPSGCEVTSLDMALLYKGVNIDKIMLANKMPYTNTLDPNKGFVGSPYNYTGYTINPIKLQELAKVYRSGSSDLTGVSITTIENEIRKGNPVLVWYTIGYVNVINHYKYQNGQKYWWPQPLHCIVVTGVGSKNFYINDPLNGNKNYPIDKTRFNKIYTDMGKRALVVR
jgi:uncharacterized protein YvpB/LysM repeat protein